MKLRLLVSIAPLAMLVACSGQNKADGKGQGNDPASEQALNDNLMTDPDMAGRNEAGAALTGTGNNAVPRIDTSARAINAARERAAELVGGTENFKAAPAARNLAADAPDGAVMTAAARALMTPGGDNCAQRVSYTSAWAAKLPSEFPVYPRANTQEAAGTDDGNCGLRVVTFRTPVTVSDVLTFYNTRATAAGYSVDHAIKQGENVLSGTHRNAAYVVYVRRLDGKVTEVDLITSGR